MNLFTGFFVAFTTNREQKFGDSNSQYYIILYYITLCATLYNIILMLILINIILKLGTKIIIQYKQQPKKVSRLKIYGIKMRPHLRPGSRSAENNTAYHEINTQVPAIPQKKNDSV